MIRAALIFLLVVVGCSAANVDADRLAGALRLREGYRGRDGAAGERGPWQIKAEVWAMHMPGIPFAKAREEAPARACALKHIAWLAGRLEARGVAVTPFNLAAAWNAGLTGYTTGRAPERAYHYAADVAALYLNAGLETNTSRPLRGVLPGRAKLQSRQRAESAYASLLVPDQPAQPGFPQRHDEFGSTRSGSIHEYRERPLAALAAFQSVASETNRSPPPQSSRHMSPASHLEEIGAFLLPTIAKSVTPSVALSGPRFPLR